MGGLFVWSWLEARLPTEKLLSRLRPGATLLADKAYDTDAIRRFAKQRRCWLNIPAKANRNRPSASAAGSIASATTSSAFSIVSSRCAASPHDMTAGPTTIWQHSSSQR